MCGKIDDDMLGGWKDYKRYWKERGKSSFDEYIQNMKNKKNADKSE